ncbi:hypothetical protein [Butyricicoccus sp.]
MKKEKEKIKKPWYKRKLIWAIIIIVFIMAIGSNGESTSTENTKQNTAAADTQQQPNTESADTTKDEDTAQAAVSEDTSEQKEDAAADAEDQTSAIDGIKFTVSDVRNDKTGNWRISLIAENIEMQNCALDYYKHYFKDDKEIHAIVNFNYNTTTKISVVGNKLDVSVFEYVKKEEHDANLLFSGQLLKEYLVDKETGAVEEVK